MSQPVRKDGKKKVYLFSHSQFSKHNMCPMKYKNHYVDMVRPREQFSPALIMGSAFHAGLENLYEGKRPHHAIARVFKEAEEKTKTAEHIAQMKIDQKKVLAMVKGYQQHYIAGDLSRFDKILIEEPFEIVLAETDKVKLCYEGYLDGLGIQEDGTVVVFEHKTAAQVNPDYWNRVKLDWQIRSYAWGAKEITGRWPKSVIYSVIKKTQIRRKVSESLAEFAQRVEDEYLKRAEEKGYYNREELLFDKKAVRTWKDFAKIKAKQLYRDLKNGGPWLQHTNSCMGFGGWGCEFMDLCITGKVNNMLYEKKEDTPYLGAVNQPRK